VKTLEEDEIEAILVCCHPIFFTCSSLLMFPPEWRSFHAIDNYYNYQGINNTFSSPSKAVTDNSIWYAGIITSHGVHCRTCEAYAR